MVIIHAGRLLLIALRRPQRHPKIIGHLPFPTVVVAGDFVADGRLLAVEVEGATEGKKI